MKLNREQFLAAGMMINAATGIGCGSKTDQASPEGIAAEGNAVNGANGVNGATPNQSPNAKLAPGQKALQPPALQAGVRSPTGEMGAVSPVKEAPLGAGPANE